MAKVLKGLSAPLAAVPSAGYSLLGPAEDQPKLLRKRSTERQNTKYVDARQSPCDIIHKCKIKKLEYYGTKPKRKPDVCMSTHIHTDEFPCQKELLRTTGK